MIITNRVATWRRMAFAGLIAAGALGDAAAQTATFVARHDYTIGSPGSRPRDLAIGDFNLDGHPDVAVTGEFADAVYLWFGRGDGLFRGQKYAAVPSAPASIVAGDVNGDGLPDLAVGSGGDSAVRILLGYGDGTFQVPRRLATFGMVYGLALVDLDGDAHADLVTADYLPAGTISVFIGNGTGSFGFRQSLPSGHYPVSIAVGDFDRDGRPDIAAANSTVSSIAVFLGRGDGTLQSAMTYPSGASAMCVVMADLDRDGNPDLVSANYGSDDVSVDFGSGTGGIHGQGSFEVGARPWEVVAADLNGDGLVDLATTDSEATGARTVSVLTGDGDGTFQPARTIVVGDAGDFGGYSPGGLATGDFNRDGSPDLVATNGVPGTISLLINSTRGAVIGQRVQWDRAINATAAGNTLRKSGGCDGCYDAGAISSQGIAPGPGYSEVEFVATDAISLRTVGLTHAFAAPSPEEIDFGIRLQDGAAEVRENGVYVASTLFVAGDSFRIAIESGVLTYLKNGVPFHARAVSVAVPLFLAAALADVGAPIENASITAPPPGSTAGGGGAGGIRPRVIAPFGSGP